MKIRNTIYILSAFLMLLSLTSCEDYLDKTPDDELTIEMVFNDKTRTEEWLAGIYSSIPSPYWDYARYQYDAWELVSTNRMADVLLVGAA